MQYYKENGRESKKKAHSPKTPYLSASQIPHGRTHMTREGKQKGGRKGREGEEEKRKKKIK